jgi:hypothetical protein
MWDFIKFVFTNLLNQSDGKLTAIQEIVQDIKQKQEKFIMATEQEFNDVLARIDAAEASVKSEVDKQKAEIVALQEQIKGLGLSADVEASILGKLNAQASFLEALIPVVEPAPTEPPVTPTA